MNDPNLSTALKISFRFNFYFVKIICCTVFISEFLALYYMMLVCYSAHYKYHVAGYFRIIKCLRQ